MLKNINAANASTFALALSDGTPVDFVKITSKDNIQVRVPTSHSLGAIDPLRIFDRDGHSTKNSTDLTLAATAAPAAAQAPTPTPAAAPVSNDNTTYTVNGNDFDNLVDAKQEAIDLFAENPLKNVEIFATTRKLVGTVGISLAA